MRGHALVLATLLFIWSHLDLCNTTFLSSQNQDILSAFTWASLDLPHPGLDLFTPEEGLMLTSEQIAKAATRHKRRRRFLVDTDKDKKPPFIEMEVKFIIPLFQVLGANHINFEVPYQFDMEWPEILRRSGGEAAMEWQEAIGEMLHDFEDMVSMFGIDGGGCVRKALCEMASLPALKPQGIVGEMLDIFVRRAQNTTTIESNNPQETRLELEVEEEEEQDAATKKEKLDSTKKKKIKKRTRRETAEEEVTPVKVMDYLTAGTFGKLDGNCEVAFSECPVSLLQGYDM